MMKFKSAWFLYGYFFMAIIHLVSLIFQDQFFSAVSKIMLMPFLAFYVYDECRAELKNAGVLLIGIFFSWLGDILLIKSQNEMFFIFGIATFLCAHIAYIVSFRTLRYIYSSVSSKSIYGVFFLFYSISMLYFIYPNLNELKFPVIIYSLVISIMGIAALMRKGATLKKSFNFVLSGAILFILSDSFIAINRFYQPFNFASILIMATYIIAQYLIIAGCVIHLQQSAYEETL